MTKENPAVYLRLNNESVRRTTIIKILYVKVRTFSGSKINNTYSYNDPLLNKELDCILLHVGTNDAPYKSSEFILTELLQLKSYIENVLPEVIVILSQPTMRIDNAKAGLTLKYLCFR